MPLSKSCHAVGKREQRVADKSLVHEVSPIGEEKALRYANGSYSWGKPPWPLASPFGRRPDCLTTRLAPPGVWLYKMFEF